MVARLDPIKNHRLVIDALPLLICRYPNTTLEFIGEGVELARLRRGPANGVSRTCRFSRPASMPVPGHARMGSVSLYNDAAEGFGAALAEALALGLPSVVTDVGPMREVGGEDGAVRYVPPNSPAELAGAAAVLIADHRARREMSARARARAAANFDGAHFCKAYCRVVGGEGPFQNRGAARARVA